MPDQLTPDPQPSRIFLRLLRSMWRHRRPRIITSDGVPADEYFAGAVLPDVLKNARVYQTKCGPVIARAEE